MAVNVIKYARNVARSFGYAAVDVMGDLNPTIKSFSESNDELGKDTPEEIKIVTFKLTNLLFKMLFTKFDFMIDDNEDINETLDNIFRAYESNDYNDTDVKFEYDSCKFDQ